MTLQEYAATSGDYEGRAQAARREHGAIGEAVVWLRRASLSNSKRLIESRANAGWDCLREAGIITPDARPCWADAPYTSCDLAAAAEEELNALLAWAEEQAQ